MKEFSRTYYVAEDGKEFTSKQECYEYECKLTQNNNWFQIFERIKDMCQEHNEECEGCPFLCGIHCGLTSENAPMDWNLKKWEGFK